MQHFKVANIQGPILLRGWDTYTAKGEEGGPDAEPACDGHEEASAWDEHPDSLASMSNLASTYCNQGRWKEAEVLEVLVIQTRIRVFGEEHPHSLTTMGNLASTYRNQGQLKDAEELEMLVMEVMKRVLGKEHPDSLTSMANLASTYRHQGRWKEAEELQVLRGRGYLARNIPTHSRAWAT